jgi:YbbR domain-containing protein
VINLSGNVQLAGPLSPVAVTVSGPAPALSSLALNPNDFKVVVDVSGRGPGRFDADVKVQQVPTGLTAESVAPNRVTVELREIPATPTPTSTPVPPAP